MKLYPSDFVVCVLIAVIKSFEFLFVINLIESHRT